TGKGRIALAVPESLTISRWVKRNVHDGLELDGGSLFCGRPEFPLAQGFHGVGIELLVDATDQLNALDRAVAANHGVEHDLALHTFFDQCGRILRIDLPERPRSGNVRGSRPRSFGI